MATVTRTLAVLAMLLALIGLTTPVAAQPLYSITDLGALPNTGGCTAFGISDQAAVVGLCAGAGSLNETAFVWRNGVMTNLGKLPKAHYSAAWSMNAAGVAVGEGDTGDFRPDPTLYRDGRVIDIDASGGNARAIHITDAGVIVGNYSKGFGNANSWSAVIWTEDPRKPGRFSRVGLPAYPGGDTKARYGYALGANQSVQVVGYVQNTLFGQKGAFWNNDANHTLALLEPPAGHWTSLAFAVNDLGQAVGQSHPPFRTRAVMWLDDAAHTPVELGALPGDVDSTAAGINNAGQIIGTSTSSDGVSRPFLWQNGQMVDMNSLLDASGADWVISNVIAINNLGQIVGTGLYQGQARTFVMTPAGQ